MTFDFVLYDQDDCVLTLTDGTQIFVMNAVADVAAVTMGHLLTDLRSAVEAMHAAGCDVRRISVCNMQEGTI